MGILRNALLGVGLTLALSSTPSFAQESRKERIKRLKEEAVRTKDRIIENSREEIWKGVDRYYNKEDYERREAEDDRFPTPLPYNREDSNLEKFKKILLDERIVYKVTIPTIALLGLAVFLYTRDVRKRRILERKINRLYDKNISVR